MIFIQLQSAQGSAEKVPTTREEPNEKRRTRRQEKNPMTRQEPDDYTRIRLLDNTFIIQEYMGPEHLTEVSLFIQVDSLYCFFINLKLFTSIYVGSTSDSC